jgi:hypothetical protein
MTKKSPRIVAANAERVRASRKTTGADDRDRGGRPVSALKPKSRIGAGPPQPRLLYSRQEVAALLGVSTRTVCRLQADGLLRPVKLRPTPQAKTLYSAEDVHKLAQPGGPQIGPAPAINASGEDRISK